MTEHQQLAIVPVLLEWIEVAALGLELLAVGVIITVALVSTTLFVHHFRSRDRRLGAYERYKVQLGRGLLLGLEILVAADVVRTVALEPTLGSVSVLGILVLIRTFLGWSLTVEIEHRWPWQAPPHSGLEAGSQKDEL